MDQPSPLFALMSRANDGVIGLNLLLLLGVTWLPFPTALLAEHLRGENQHVAALVYSATFVFIAVIFNILWRYAIRSGVVVAHVHVSSISRHMLLGRFSTPSLQSLRFLAPRHVLSSALPWPSISLCRRGYGRGRPPSEWSCTRVNSFRVFQIDHVELFVPDRHEAAALVPTHTLGLEIVPEYQEWAADPRGPLMISSDDGNTKLALFEGQPQASRPTAGFHRVAFRVNAGDFMEFLQRLRDRPLKDHRDRPVTSDSVVDHGKAYSVYFSDPYGHRLEVTTYEYEATRAALIGIRPHGR